VLTCKVATPGSREDIDVPTEINNAYVAGLRWDAADVDELVRSVTKRNSTHEA